MDLGTENHIVDLADAVSTHEDWLTLIRFGLPTLLENQRLFAELIVREAEREAKEFNADRVTGLHRPADHVAQILGELNLKLVVAS